jgi:BirA family biotin operon repressor/biotin-[acetyl-CoA-carboxylase] ligase
VVHWFDELPSTQDEGHRLAADGAQHGTAVAARIQTAGRGTRGRAWVSNAGGLWLSVIARPEAGEGLPVLSLRVGLALADHLDTLLQPTPSPTVRRSVRPSVRLKWPNDLLLDDRKLGGILCEARWQGDRLGWIVVGIGLNVHNPLPDSTATAATRLADYGFSGEPEAIVEALARVTARATR